MDSTRQKNSFLWIRQLSDSLEVVHDLLGVVSVNKTLYDACNFIDGWPTTLFSNIKFPTLVRGTGIEKEMNKTTGPGGEC